MPTSREKEEGAPLEPVSARDTPEITPEMIAGAPTAEMMAGAPTAEMMAGAPTAVVTDTESGPTTSFDGGDASEEETSPATSGSHSLGMATDSKLVNASIAVCAIQLVLLIGWRLFGRARHAGAYEPIST